MSLRLAVSSAVLLALIWLVLARELAPAVGVLAVAAALWTLRRTAAPRLHRLRWSRLPPLAATFLWQSLAGGIDVTRRILAPAMPLAPGLVTLRLALPDEGARVLLALLVSLMPGTLAARLEGDALTLHVLDLRLPVEAETRRIERLIGRLYGADATPAS